MKKAISVIICLALIVSASLVFSGCEKIILGDDYRLPELYSAGSREIVCEPAVIEILWVKGDIEIVQDSSSDKVVITENNGLADELKVHSYFDEETSTVYIQFWESGHIGKVNAEDKKLRVSFPSADELRVVSESSDVTCSSLTVGRIDLTSATGSVKTGDIVTDALRVTLVSGGLEADSVKCDDVNISGVSGSISLGATESEKFDISTDSGDVSIKIAGGDELEINTVSGSVTVYVPDSGSKLMYNTVSGEMTSDVASTFKDKRYYFGLGTVKIYVTTVSGSLHVTQ